MTSFAAILEDTVAHIPHAIGGAFAAQDGEMVDAHTTISEEDWAIVTAHFGVILNHIVDALGTLHHGAVTQLYFPSKTADLIIQPVGDGYYTLLAVKPPVPFPVASKWLDVAVERLREEMA